MTIMLDTSAYSSLLRTELRVDPFLETATTIAMSPIVVGELKYGFLRGSRNEKNLKQLESFLNEKDVIICDIDADTAEIYAQLKLKQHEIGKTVASNDLWIAASAVQMGAKLITLDSDFRNVMDDNLNFVILG